MHDLISSFSRYQYYYLAAIIISLIINYLLYKFWKFKFLNSIVKSDRWGKHSIPLTGGIAVFAIFIISVFLQKGIFTASSNIIIAIAGACAMFLLGLIDDIVDLKSYQKFLGQAIIVLMVVGFGVNAGGFYKLLSLGHILSLCFTFLWILGITNSFNLLDNMDGLSGGIALIACIFLGIHFTQEQNLLLSYYSFILGAALLGFLIFNFNPAKIYLGDSGALFVGFFLAALTVLGSQGTGASLFSVLAFPLILLLVPILDTTLVSITRRMRGQSPFQGGRDHLSHRLVTLGLSDRQAVIFLYLIAISLGVSTFLLQNVSIFISIAVYFFISIIFLLFGIYIGKIEIAPVKDSGNEFASMKPVMIYKKKIFNILLDIILIGVIYYSSYIIRFGSGVVEVYFDLIQISLPVIIITKILALYFFKVYDIDNRYFSLTDTWRIITAMAIGATVTITIFAYVQRFGGFSRGVFLIDWFLSFIIVGGIKVFERFLDEFFLPFKAKKRGRTIYIGDIDTFQAVNKFLQIKSNFQTKIFKYIDIQTLDIVSLMNHVKSNEEKKSAITKIVIEDKYIKKIEKADLDKIKKNNVEITNEKEFILQILE